MKLFYISKLLSLSLSKTIWDGIKLNVLVEAVCFWTVYLLACGLLKLVLRYWMIKDCRYDFQLIRGLPLWGSWLIGPLDSSFFLDEKPVKNKAYFCMFCWTHSHIFFISTPVRLNYRIQDWHKYYLIDGLMPVDVIRP